MKTIKEFCESRIELEKKISPAPWESRICYDKDGTYRIDTGVYYARDESGSESDQCILNAEFLEQMRNEYRPTYEALRVMSEALEFYTAPSGSCKWEELFIEDDGKRADQALDKAQELLNG